MKNYIWLREYALHSGSSLLKVSLVVPLSLPTHILHSFKLEVWQNLEIIALKLSTYEIILFLNLKYKNLRYKKKKKKI